jgi:hypothetical protein
MWSQTSQNTPVLNKGFLTVQQYMFESSSRKYNGHFTLPVFFRIYKLLAYVGTVFVMYQAKKHNVVSLVLLFINVTREQHNRRK